HKEQAERDRIGDTLDFEIKRWSTGKQGNLRALLSTLQYIRPSDKKVDYQIQKLTNAADNATAREKSGNAEVNGKDGHSDEEDLLKYRPNPDMMDTDWFSWSGAAARQQGLLRSINNASPTRDSGESLNPSGPIRDGGDSSTRSGARRKRGRMMMEDEDPLICTVTEAFKTLSDAIKQSAPQPRPIIPPNLWTMMKQIPVFEREHIAHYYGYLCENPALAYAFLEMGLDDQMGLFWPPSLPFLVAVATSSASRVRPRLLAASPTRSTRTRPSAPRPSQRPPARVHDLVGFRRRPDPPSLSAPADRAAALSAVPRPLPSRLPPAAGQPADVATSGRPDPLHHLQTPAADRPDPLLHQGEESHQPLHHCVPTLGRGIARLPDVSRDWVNTDIAPVLNLDVSDVERLKEQYACCTEDQLAFEGYRKLLPTRKALPDGQVITIEKERYIVGEALFQPHILGLEDYGIVHQLVTSASNVSSEYHRQLLENTMLCGGTTSMTGFEDRFQREANLSASAIFPSLVK
ncbi:hypothetical protein ACJX0J_009304, partial [Zea mays]